MQEDSPARMVSLPATVFFDMYIGGAYANGLPIMPTRLLFTLWIGGDFISLSASCLSPL
jgi:hypothetical protein